MERKLGTLVAFTLGLLTNAFAAEGDLAAETTSSAVITMANPLYISQEPLPVERTEFIEGGSKTQAEIGGDSNIKRLSETVLGYSSSSQRSEDNQEEQGDMSKSSDTIPNDNAHKSSSSSHRSGDSEEESSTGSVKVHSSSSSQRSEDNEEDQSEASKTTSSSQEETSTGSDQEGTSSSQSSNEGEKGMSGGAKTGFISGWSQDWSLAQWARTYLKPSSPEVVPYAVIGAALIHEFSPSIWVEVMLDGALAAAYYGYTHWHH